MPVMPGTPPLGPAALSRVRIATPPTARRAVTLLLATLVTALAAVPERAAAAPAAAGPGCSGAAAPLGVAAAAAVEAAIACLVGAERAARGLPPVRAAGALALAARRHAADMVARRFFAHVSPSGGTVDRRARRAGYLEAAPCWALGEDLGWAPPAVATAQAVVAAWMASPSHRSVILDDDFREIGVAVAGGAPVGDDAGATFVLELGATMPCARTQRGARAAPRTRVRAG
jgi:uncharacterized protein YkwD